MQKRQTMLDLKQQQPFSQLVVYFAYALDLCKDTDRMSSGSSYSFWSTHITPVLAWPDLVLSPRRSDITAANWAKKAKDHSRWPDKLKDWKETGYLGHACAGSNNKAHATWPAPQLEAGNSSAELELELRHGPLARMQQHQTASGRLPGRLPPGWSFRRFRWQ